MGRTVILGVVCFVSEAQLPDARRNSSNQTRPSSGKRDEKNKEYDVPDAVSHSYPPRFPSLPFLFPVLFFVFLACRRAGSSSITILSAGLGLPS